MSRSSGNADEEVDPAPDRTRTSFYLKFLPSPTGKGFDGDPAAGTRRRDERTRKQWRVDGEIILRESRFDPVVDLPVRELLDIELAERSSIQTGEVVAELSRRTGSRRSSHQRYDDLSPVGQSDPRPDVKELHGRVAVVTGGAGGIGRALGAAFGRSGMKVVLADIRW